MDVLLLFCCLAGCACSQLRLLILACSLRVQTVAVEGSGAAILGAPLVGYLAEHSFGYLRTTLLVAEMPEQLRLGNANALASALAFLTVIPWSISFLLYGLLHFTYGKPSTKHSLTPLIQEPLVLLLLLPFLFLLLLIVIYETMDKLFVLHTVFICIRYCCYLCFEP